jgi:hypothetical protein
MWNLRERTMQTGGRMTDPAPKRAGFEQIPLASAPGHVVRSIPMYPARHNVPVVVVVVVSVVEAVAP